MDEENIAQTVERITREDISVLNVPGSAVPVCRLASGSAIKSLEEFLPQPTRIRRAPHFTELPSFLEYVKEFKTGATVLFAVGESGALKAVIDYDTSKDPSWGTHEPRYTPQFTPSWKAWLDRNNRPMTQTEFAEFLEDRIADIREPDAATVLETVQDFSASIGGKFSSAVNLKSGDRQLSYTSETVPSGKAVLPSKLTLGIKVIRGGSAYEVAAKIRFRIEETKLTLRYSLDRLDGIMEDVRADICKQAKEATGLTPLAIVA